MARIHGHQHALESLEKALESDRLHHAWIFSGPVGVGKRTTAEEFARVLLDPDTEPSGLGQDENALLSEAGQLLAAGTHPDLHVLRKEDAAYSDNRSLRDRKQMNIPLDLLRERMIGGRTSDGKSREAPVYRTPLMGNGKVFVIDEAELLDRTAQNVLLKTLEEPPAGTVIILVSAKPNGLIATIRSRCQHLRFGTLDTAAMNGWIKDQGPELDDQSSIEWLAGWSEGSPGQFVSAASHGLIGWAQTLTPMLTQADAGDWHPELASTMIDFVEQFAEIQMAENTKASKEAANREGVRQLLRLLGYHLRNRLARCEDGERATCCATIDLLSEIEQQSESHLNLKQLMESLSAGWAAPETVPVSL
ncbi:MAG: hypothetical protein CMJ36_00875 [Phycisphaerae bacterium]|nr:hypothetical protein [Phycisphaerae bacterium]